MDLAIIEHIEKICGRKECAFYPTEKDPSIQCYGCAHYRDATFDMLTSSKESAATEKLKFVGSATQRTYTGDNVDCKQGDEILVSMGKKAQLLKDHPSWFEEVVKSKTKKPLTPEEEQTKKDAKAKKKSNAAKKKAAAKKKKEAESDKK